MQDKTPKSHLIRLNNLANKKARRRLIGSIFLLIVALLILFHVSAKIKPIPIKPESIEIKTHNKIVSSAILNNNPIIVESREDFNKTVNTESQTKNITKPIAAENESATLVKTQVMEKSVASASAHKDLSKNNSAPLKSTVNPSDLLDQSQDDTNNSDKKPVSSKEIVAKPVNLHITPTIAIEQGTVRKPTPEDILNGTLPEKAHPKYFVQLMASSDKTKLAAAKSKLASKGIFSSIQSTKHGTNTIYRLRIGPFNDKNKAKGKLAEIQDKLNN